MNASADIWMEEAQKVGRGLITLRFVFLFFGGIAALIYVVFKGTAIELLKGKNSPEDMLTLGGFATFSWFYVVVAVICTVTVKAYLLGMIGGYAGTSEDSHGR